MIKVWVLVALVNSGHLSFSMVPTLEFSTKEKCDAAITRLQTAASQRTIGSFSGFCQEIEK